MNTHNSHEKIDEEAARWAVHLESGDMNEDDHAAFSLWLNTSPEHRRVFSSYQNLSTRLDMHIEQLLEPAINSAMQEKAKKRRRTRVYTAVLATAAMIAFVFASMPRRPLEYGTKTAERHMTTLADGSQLELNAQTSVIVDFSRDERHVKLTSGEALFTVANDSKRPFIAETPTGRVRVTGTVFNIRTTNKECVEVTVLEGTVRVSPSENATLEQPVSAGMQASLSAQQISVLTLPDGASRDVTAWRQGQVVFNETPLSDVVERFAAYHARTIVVDPKAADLRIGGRYSLEDLNGLLESIQGFLPVHVEYGPGATMRITAIPEPVK